MQIQRTAAAPKQSAGDRRLDGPAPADVASAADIRRRRLGMTGPGERRVPSLVALRGAARHSRIVRMMRVILPALALLVMGLVALQAFMYEADDTLKLSFADTGALPDDGKMMSPELSFPFGKDNWFRATAGSAERDDGGRVVVTDIQSDMTAGGDGWFSLSARNGILDIKEEQVILSGGIEFFSSYGQEFRTESAILGTRDGTIKSQSEVTGQGPLGALRCDGFSVSDSGSRIRCEGNVQMTFSRPVPPSG
jgi:lipopolysaccharide export system protein LptC